MKYGITEMGSNVIDVFESKKEMLSWLPRKYPDNMATIRYSMTIKELVDDPEFPDWLIILHGKKAIEYEASYYRKRIRD
jgi:hypothetical protein